MKRSSVMLGVAAALAGWLGGPADGWALDLEVGVTNLVTDDQTAHPAVIEDTALVNAWGVSRSGTSPFWVSDNGSGQSTLYSVSPSTGTPAKLGLNVAIPGAGSVTGQVFANLTGAFNSDLFLFVGEDGTVSGWRNSLGTTAEVLALGSSDNVYKGAAFSNVNGLGYLYAANFRSGAIDVLKGSAGAPDLAARFIDPNLPSGYAPFNIENLGGSVFVTYALQDANKLDDVAGGGNGFVDVFDVQGNFSKRLVSNGALNSPWGLAVAPSSFAALAGDLLVGNFGDGRIHAYNPTTGALDGTLTGPGGQPLEIDGLWGLMAGSGAGNGGSADAIYFTAGPDGETHGLFGVLSVPEPSSFTLLALGLVVLARRRAASIR
jgi:uncharacterized protein (TIGR03118 family)